MLKVTSNHQEWEATLQRSDFIIRLQSELERMYVLHGRQPWGRHEFYAILKEEVDEVWDDIKGDKDSVNLQKEIIQVAAVCLRYLETGDRYKLDPSLKETKQAKVP